MSRCQPGHRSDAVMADSRTVNAGLKNGENGNNVLLLPLPGVMLAMRYSKLLRLSLAIVLLNLVAAGLHAQQPEWRTDADRSLARTMLQDLKHDLQKNYYDAHFRGVNIEERFKAAEEKIQEAASLNQAFGVIAWALDGLNDSHTFFIPPPRPYKHDYGWRMQMIGDQCYAVAVMPRSDAEAKELKTGDRIVSMDGFVPARDNLWKLKYLYNVLNPQFGMRLIVQGLDGRQRTLEIRAKFREGKRVLDFATGRDFWEKVWESERVREFVRQREVELGPDLMIWKMPQFNLSDKAVDERMAKARKHNALILDLRGNPGGAENTVLRLLGNLFDHDVKVANVKRRTETKSLVAKTRGDRAFAGKLVVLVDSNSASASEIVARVVQLEKRGIVIGDQTPGAVMEAEGFTHVLGLDRIVYYAALITHADIVMADGKSLERLGVVPDERVLPTAVDLAANRDPVLSRAAALTGVTLTPEEAGKLFPVEWLKD